MLKNNELSNLTEEVKKFLKDKGADLVGIASPDRLANAPDNHKPENFLPDVKSLISIGLKLNVSVVKGLPKTRREYRMVYDNVNFRLNTLACDVSCLLESKGYKAIPFPASRPYDEKNIYGDISHKHIAVAAGLGRFGLNNLVLTPDYGPYVRFTTVITNAPLKPDPLLLEDICNWRNCLNCVKVCPVNALENPQYNPVEGWRMDKDRCRHYLFVVLSDSGEVCGLCIKACPAGKKLKNIYC
ncbi:MAG: 4Fe-4S dicluster domain-containing protein [Candidatus Bathyarchaeota archaeon]